jgi:hypothetical protein
MRCEHSRSQGISRRFLPERECSIAAEDTAARRKEILKEEIRSRRWRS